MFNGIRYLTCNGSTEQTIQLLRTTGNLPKTTIIATNPTDDTGILKHAIDWKNFWNDEDNETDWLIEPLIARGRGHALWAQAKVGKSLLGLEMAAALATGRPFLGHTNQPANVIYIDYEMTRADIRERLDGFNYSEDDDLSRLHYLLTPVIDGLDTINGGIDVYAAAKQVDAKLVIIDTLGRAVVGEENSADTIRNFYRNCALALKSLGVAYLRLDHGGKSIEKGQRGTSAKNDDVDIVWRLTYGDSGTGILKATYARMGWVPDQVALQRAQLDGGFIEHRKLAGRPEAEWPPGTKQLADDLNSYSTPINATNKEAQTILRKNGQRVSNQRIGKALKFRRLDAETPPPNDGQNDRF
jgi:hypothetical protein